uniref:Pentatricopeptide repeat-containing protein n=1 Tax=Tanacetum cinerariifolium TaxID=118510 RepID=A0A6L2L2E3_TANCI|nr:hypothetical protein [Tanacetum cinerariifolium]
MVEEEVKAFNRMGEYDVEAEKKAFSIPDVVVYTSLVHGWCRAGNIGEAKRVFREMKLSEVKLNVYTYTIVIDALCRNGQISRVHDVFAKMLDEGIMPNSITYNNLMRVHVKAGRTVKVRQVYNQMKRLNCEPDLITYNFFIETHCKDENLDDAVKASHRFFGRMKALKCKQNTVSYNLSMRMFVESKSADMVLKLKEEMDENEVELNVNSYRILIGINGDYDMVLGQLRKAGQIKKHEETVEKMVNDVIRLQALVDKKKVVVTEATIREALRLDDAEGVECLSNEEIFAELARMGYEKPSTKLTFYKAFFLSELNLVRNVDSTSKFYMYPRFLQLIIRKQIGDLLTHTTKYTSPALTQKVFANMRRVGKGFFRVETSLFAGMLVEQQVAEEGDAEVHGEEVNAGDTAKGDVTAAHGEVPTADEEPSITSPTPPTPPPQPSHDIPSTSQLERRVKKLKRRNKVRVLKLRRLQKVGTSQRVETSDETVMDDVADEAKKVAEDAKEDETEPAEVQEVVDVVTTAKLITEVVTAASETITAACINITAVEAQVPAVTLTDAPARVTAAPERVTVAPKEPKPLKKKQQIKQDEQYDRELEAKLNKNIYWDEAIDHVKQKAKEDLVVKRYPNVAFSQKTKEQIEEKENRALKRLNETPAEKAAKKKATPLARKVLVVDYHIIELNNKPYYKIIRADDTQQLYLCSNLEESKKCTWSIKGQGMEAIGIMWCTDHNVYNHTADFVSREEVHSTTTSRRPARMMVEHVLRQAKE